MILVQHQAVHRLVAQTGSAVRTERPNNPAPARPLSTSRQSMQPGRNTPSHDTPDPRHVPDSVPTGQVHRSERRHGRLGSPRYAAEAFAAARRVLGPRLHREAVADVVDIVHGYAKAGLRDDSGDFRGIVVVAVRAVAPCDEDKAVALLVELEQVISD